ncbi:MAG TPA: hypothetical protein VH164_12035, partial [Ktedonobacteraceae bacterium]|nr:hypothetical protein [Ktedonobacteraceae bacterium]
IHHMDTVLSELKQHLGTGPDFCYPSPDKKCKRKASPDEMSLLCSVCDQEASKANRTGLCDLFSALSANLRLMNGLVPFSTILRVLPG